MATQTFDPATAEAFVGRLFTAALGAADLVSVYLGDRLGLYKAFRPGRGMNTAELHRRTGIHGRYAREWLEQQAATGILTVDDVNAHPMKRRYSLPPAHAVALTDPDSPFSIAPLARTIVGAMPVMPKILDAYRNGTGVAWSAYGMDTIEAQGDFNRPWLLGQLGNDFLPKVPDVHERLSRARPAARVLDVACGVGWAGIAIALAYPTVKVLGLDLDGSSIKLAKQNTAAKGVQKRVSHRRLDVAKLDTAERFDFAILVESLHDMSQPVPVLRAIREHLTLGASLMVVDEKTAERFLAPADDVERFLYAASLMVCLVNSMADRPTAATGTVIRPSTVEKYGHAAGFRHVDQLSQIDHPFLRFYQFRP